MGKNWVDFKEIKEKVSMQMVLDHYGLLDRLKKSGPSLVGCCPIHSGTNPRQFSVTLDKNVFNCFGNCQAGGNVLDFVAKMEKVDIKRAGELLAEWFNLGNGNGQAENSEKKTTGQGGKDNKRVSELVRKEKTGDGVGAVASPGAVEKSGVINPPLSFQLKGLEIEHDFFKARGLSAETVDHFGLGFCRRGSMSGRIVIPLHDEAGALVAYCGRAVDDDAVKYKMPNGFAKSAVLYNLHRQEKGAGLLIVVESFLSVYKLWQAGIKNVVALMGSSMSEDQQEEKPGQGEEAEDFGLGKRRKL